MRMVGRQDRPASPEKGRESRFAYIDTAYDLGALLSRLLQERQGWAAG